MSVGKWGCNPWVYWHRIQFSDKAILLMVSSTFVNWRWATLVVKNSRLTDVEASSDMNHAYIIIYLWYFFVNLTHILDHVRCKLTKLQALFVSNLTGQILSVTVIATHTEAFMKHQKEASIEPLSMKIHENGFEPQKTLPFWIISWYIHPDSNVHPSWYWLKILGQASCIFFWIAGHFLGCHGQSWIICPSGWMVIHSYGFMYPLSEIPMVRWP